MIHTPSRPKHPGYGVICEVCRLPLTLDDQGWVSQETGLSCTASTADRLAAARAVAGYELGDPSWADVIIGAYQDPAGARRDRPEAFEKD
jgi:hypothetical protein